MSEKVEDNFKVFANTFCIGKNISENYKVLIDVKKSYRIPIFQRPYSWNIDIVSKFIIDIINSYISSDGQILKRPIFVGTIQLSEPKINKYDIIDGQQRLTTLLLFFKVLNEKSQKTLQLDWLETVVNNGEQQRSLNEVMDKNIYAVHETIDNRYLNKRYPNNRYAQNILVIHQILEDINRQRNNFQINDFIDYLLSKVYFVVIETHAGLSKTLQIFDTINTTGLSLDGSDIFKIRIYEYLTTVKHEDESIFDEISGLYEKLEISNKDHQKGISFLEILNLYQYILIANFNLPKSLYELNSATFFERLFDGLLGIKEWKNFSKAKDVELSLEPISNLIDTRFEWEFLDRNNIDYLSAHHFIGWSRYGKYSLLRILFYDSVKSLNDYMEQLSNFTILLSKVFLVYSIRYAKTVNEIKQFAYRINKNIQSDNLEKIQQDFESKLSDHQDDGYFEKRVSLNLTDNAKRKDIICRIAAFNYEKEKNLTAFEVTQKLFKDKIDIEHIQSYNDNNIQERDNIKEEWGDELNGLGNLVILERDFNRSISNKPFVKKKEIYKQSKYNIVRKLSEYDNWYISNAEERRKKLTQEVKEYLLSN